MSSTRQLAAIMFTDIVGYTALMGEDEQKAFEILKRNRSIQKPIIAQFNGRWLKEMGDGVLASFTTVTDAIHCAAKIQKTCEHEPDLKLRIGIHQGEVVFDGDDVFGDGVNIASRLQAEAPIGGILVSDSVYKNVTNKNNIQSSYLGERPFKNVREPVKVYEVTVDDVEPAAIFAEPSDKGIGNDFKISISKKAVFGAIGLAVIIFLAYFFYSNTSKAEPPSEALTEIDRSVIVLPFTNLSNDPDQDYFSDGMTEEIIDHLVKIKDLKVVSSTTSMIYRGTNKSAKEIALELGIATVLEGSVRKEGNQVRITVQLIEGATDTHLFSQSYDRQLNNVFDVQSEVAQKVAGALQAQILPEVRLSIEEIPTQNTRAYELYLKGREQLSLRWTDGDISRVNQAMDFFKQAIKLDPDFSDAYAELGHSYWVLAHFSPDYDPVFWDSSKHYLQKAIAIDPNNGRAYAHLGVIRHNWDWNKQSALNSFQKAVASSPSDASVHNHLYYFYLRTGECDQAEAEARVSHALMNREYDPATDGRLLLCRRDMDKIAELKEERNDFRLMMFQSKYQQVIDIITNMDTIRDPGLYLELGEALAISGDTARPMELIRRMQQVSKEMYVPPTAFARIYMSLGQKEKAYEMLEKALEERDYRIHFAHTQSISLYREWDDPRYQSILARSWIPRD